ncbi:MAG: hypothetical protein JNL62_26065, partial [Bryobacterales bacterium]|nr:hypothetical protein [Bryobacterales bacterium]
MKNALQPQLAGLADAFVAKFQPDGTLAFATYLGGSGEENGRVQGGVRFDRSGAISFAGWTRSTNFPLKNAVQSAYAGGQDAFVAKLDPTGSSLVFSTYLGGTADDFPNGFDLDTNGNPVLVGRTLSPDFPTHNGRQLNRLGFSDGFLARFDGAGSRLLYSSYVGHSAFSTLNSVAAAPDGTLAVTGVGSICAQTYWCVGRFSAAHEFTLFYGLNNVPFRSVTFDPFGNLIVVAIPDLENTVGRPNVTLVDPVRNKMIGDDPILLQFRPDGRLLFSTFWGGFSTVMLSGSFTQSAIGAVADSSGALYLAGYTTATDIYTTPTAVQPAASKGSEVFLVKFAPGSNQTITSVRAQTNTYNVPLIAAGRTSTSPVMTQMLPGDTVHVEAPERFETSFVRDVFKELNNGGPRSQTITVGTSDIFLHAIYIEDVKIETVVEPAGSGTIELSPAPADGFYRTGTPITARARPAPGFVFSSWTGQSYFFGSNPVQTQIVGNAPPNAPLRIRAKFVPGVPPPTGLSFVPVMPCRILDTRPEYGFAAPFGAPALDAGATREVAVAAGNCGIPQGAGAYALNITAVPLEPLG